VHWWDQVARELFIDLLTALFEFFYSIHSAYGVHGVVMLYGTMTVKTERDRVVCLAGTAFGLWNDVVHLNIDAASFLAKATVTVAPKENLGSKSLIKGHKLSSSLTYNLQLDVLNSL
jgi:hypothetical protein